MSDTNETIADIIAEKRRRAAEMEKTLGDQHSFVESLKDDADRLDAARKREIDVLKQRCAELNAEVAAKDEVIKRLNDAISAEQRRKMATAEKPSAVGDAAKLREAVEVCLHAFQMTDWTTLGTSRRVVDLIQRCKAALAAPARNCDVGTAQEQDERFHRFCVMQRKGSCAGCPDPVGGRTVANGIRECALIWAQMPYESGAAK